MTVEFRCRRLSILYFDEIEVSKHYWQTILPGLFEQAGGGGPKICIKKNEFVVSLKSKTKISDYCNFEKQPKFPNNEISGLPYFYITIGQMLGRMELSKIF